VHFRALGLLVPRRLPGPEAKILDFLEGHDPVPLLRPLYNDHDYALPVLLVVNGKIAGDDVT